MEVESLQFFILFFQISLVYFLLYIDGYIGNRFHTYASRKPHESGSLDLRIHRSIPMSYGYGFGSGSFLTDFPDANKKLI